MNEQRPTIVPSVTRRVAPAPLSLHIERVVIDGFGFTAAQGGQLRTALEQELGRLWRRREGGVEPRGFASPSMTAPVLARRGAPSAARLGQDAARGLFTLLGIE